MLALLKTYGGPSKTVCFAPILYLPSLPAVNVWPALPVIVPDA
jgi:hypothetical protein